jgi:endonuclease/exonuclease/phosphatase family metal-dependent hydrolase
MFLIAGVASYINPASFVLPSYASLLFLPLLLINIIFFLFWALRLKWFLVFPLVAIACMWSNIHAEFPIHKQSANKIINNDSSAISILSYNVKLFDFYKKSKTAENYNKILDYVLDRDADVVCLQEFGYYNTNDFLSGDDILNAMKSKYPYHHIMYHLSDNQKSTYGVATFSKFPIIKKGEVNYGSAFNHTIYSDIKIDTTIVRLFNCHLESNRLTINDKKKMVELIDSTSQEKISETASQLGRKLGAASKKRALQADSVAQKISQSPYPAIVCGDFNDTPISYTYRKMKGGLTDVFATTSSGLGITYNELPFLFRIDYIFHDKSLQSGNFKIDKTNLSDHYPISCDIQINN